MATWIDAHMTSSEQYRMAILEAQNSAPMAAIPTTSVSFRVELKSNKERLFFGILGA
jgi:hypothetical protein